MGISPLNQNQQNFNFLQLFNRFFNYLTIQLNQIKD